MKATGERGERRLWCCRAQRIMNKTIAVGNRTFTNREERPERVAAVDRCQGAPTTQADVGHRNRNCTPC